MSRLGAIGAGTAVCCLLIMAFLPLPGDLPYPGLEILTGAKAVDGNELAAFQSRLQILYAVDTVFILGWIVSWTGLAASIRAELPLAATLTLLFGVGAAVCDLIENGIIFGLTAQFAGGETAAGITVLVWQIFQQLSYLFAFAGAIIAVAGIDWRPLSGKITVVVGSILAIAAAAAFYLPVNPFLVNSWFFFWFAAVGWMLWDEGTARA